MKPWSVLFLVLLLSALLGCSDSVGPSEIQPDLTIEQKYLFDAWYVNYSHGYQLRGTYINNEGYVVRYNHSFEQWVPEDWDNLTEAELDEKYVAPYDTVAVINPATLYEMYEKITLASLGELSERENVAYDAGAGRRVCYQYDETSGRYGNVLLVRSGSWTQTNLSAEAMELNDWLSSVMYPEED